MFKLINNKTVLWILAAAVIVIGCVMIFFPGMSAAADYRDGSAAVLTVGEGFDSEKVTAALKAQGLTIEEVSEANDKELLVRFRQTGTAEKVAAAVETLKADYPDAAVKSAGDVKAAKGVGSVFFVLIPCAVLAILFAVYIFFLYKKSLAFAALPALLVAFLMNAAAAVIVRAEMSVFVSCGFLVTTVVAVIEAMVLAHTVRATQKYDVDAALSVLGLRLFVPSAVELAAGLIFVIVGTPMLRAFGLVLLTGAITAAYAVGYLMSATYKAMK